MKTCYYRSSRSLFSRLGLSTASRAAKTQELDNGILRLFVKDKLADSSYKQNFLRFVTKLQASRKPEDMLLSLPTELGFETRPLYLSMICQWSIHRSTPSAWYSCFYTPPFFTRSLSDFLEDVGYTQQELKAAPYTQDALPILVLPRAQPASPTVGPSVVSQSASSASPSAVSLLHTAIVDDDLDTLRQLLESAQESDDLNRFEEYQGHDFTPLMLAAALGRIEIIRLLLADNRIRADLQDDSGCDALALSCRYLQPLVLVELLKSKKCDVDAVDDKGRSNLMLVIFGKPLSQDDGRSFEEIRDDQCRMLHLLKKEGVDVNKPCAQGVTPLIAAAYLPRGSPLVFELLQFPDINPNATLAKPGRTALLISTESDDFASFLLIALDSRTDRHQKFSSGKKTERVRKSGTVKKKGRHQKLAPTKKIQVIDLLKGPALEAVKPFWHLSNESEAFFEGCSAALAQYGWDNDRITKHLVLHMG